MQPDNPASLMLAISLVDCRWQKYASTTPKIGNFHRLRTAPVLYQQNMDTVACNVTRRRKTGSDRKNSTDRSREQMWPANDGAGDDSEQRRVEGAGTEWARAIVPRSWAEEYRSAFVAIGAVLALGLILWHFDHKLSPEFGAGLDLDTIVIAIMTVLRVALGSIVESCLSQAAWIWASKSHQLCKKNVFRLEDFKLFDEASRGFLGSLALLWRMKGL